MGVVYLARSPGGRQVAVKVIRPEYAGEPGFRSRFTREVTSARGVSGMFTALVVDADTNCPTPWFATAYVPGQSLYEAVETSGPLPAATVLQLAAGLAEGLQAIHAAGVIHRDLKPSNVLLAADGPRVIDFGISKAREASMLTQTGMVMGSPGYLSPEQAEGIEVGPPSDIFSLGGVLVYAVTGQGPFGSGPTPALMFRVVSRDPDLTRVPDLILPLIKQCLVKNPALRPTPGELLAELDALGAGVGVVTPEWLPDAVTSQIARYVPTALTPATPAQPNVTTSDAAVGSGTTSDSAAPVADTPAVAAAEPAGAGLADAEFAAAGLAGAGLADELAAADAGAPAGSGATPLTPAGVEVASAVAAPDLAEAGVASAAIAGTAEPDVAEPDVAEPALAGVDTAAMASSDLADAGLLADGDAPVARVDAAAGLDAAAAVAAAAGLAADLSGPPAGAQPVADLTGTPGAGDQHDLTYIAPAAALAADVGGLATIGLASVRSSGATPVVEGPVPGGPVAGGPVAGGPGTGGPGTGGPYPSGAATGGPGGPGGTVTPLPRPNHRRLILAAAAAIVILAGVGVGAGLGLAGSGTGKATGGPTPTVDVSKSVSASASATHKATTKKATTKKAATKKATKKAKPAGHKSTPTPTNPVTYSNPPTPATSASTYVSPPPTTPAPKPTPTPTPTHTTAAPPPNQVAEPGGSYACGSASSFSGGSAATFSVTNQTSALVYVAKYSVNGAYEGEGPVAANGGSASFGTDTGYIWAVNNYADSCIAEYELQGSVSVTVVS